jgi:hypothetical protein
MLLHTIKVSMEIPCYRCLFVDEVKARACDPDACQALLDAILLWVKDISPFSVLDEPDDGNEKATQASEEDKDYGKREARTLV